MAANWGINMRGGGDEYSNMVPPHATLKSLKEHIA